MRYRVYRDHGVEGDYRNLRKSSLVEFKGLVKRRDYRGTAVAEAVAVRGRHSVATSIRNYVDEDPDRVRDMVRSPPVQRGDDPLVKTVPVPASLTPSQRLDELAKMRDAGHLKAEEFAVLRKAILDQLVASV